MKNSIYIAKISGIKIFIHWTFFILILWIIISSIHEKNNIIQILFSISFVLTLFFCVILHELGHALVAKKYNYETIDIILLPIGGIARMKEVPETPLHELIIALAGPFVNLVLAIIILPFMILVQIDPISTDMQTINGNNFLLLLFLANISLMIFNLIPAFPMDGGRVLRAILSFKMNRLKATDIAAKIGQTIAIGFFILGILFNPFLVIIAIFIFLTAQIEVNDIKSKYFLHSYKVKDAMTQHFYKIDQSSSIIEAAKLLVDTETTNFLVTDKDQIIGTINRDEIIRALKEKGGLSKIKEVMNNKIKFTNKYHNLEDVFKEFQNGKISLMPVMEDNNLTGTISMNNIIDFITVYSALQKK